MSIVLTPGYTWVDGEVETAIKMNETATPIVADGQIYPFSLGTLALPSMTFVGDTDTGFYEYAANTIGIATNGALRGTVSTYVSFLNGDDVIGSGSIPQQAFGQVGAFSYQHFIQTRHTSAAGGSGNAWVLWINNSATAGTSTAPGTGNTKAVDFSADNLRFYSNNGTLGLTLTNGQGFIAAQQALSGTNISIDFNAAALKALTLSGNTTFTTANLAAGISVSMMVTADGTNRTLTFPAGWIWVSLTPATLNANKNAVLSLISRSSTDANVYAAWAVQT